MTDVGSQQTSAFPRDDLEEERNGLDIAAAALGERSTNDGVPFYTGRNQSILSLATLISETGEQTGPTSALDVCSPGIALPRHLLIPSRAREPLPEEDINFLRAKGVFTLPEKESCAHLLRAYISHVHPMMPIIEIDQLLSHFQDGRLHEYNILLLWSVFFAAVNVRPPLDLQCTGTEAVIPVYPSIGI